ncbi:hypothetical protein NESM_000454800 [Novymonas esmeraldas]|uniref:Schlafen AlbA-2 domain-containing protein n=1 Tax=Novymonas esmeraldas TaxID=1808958 RepID=A0AAW0EQR5_9TRYP
MEVNLSSFFGDATCGLLDSNGAELAISRAFASAANACDDGNGLHISSADAPLMQGGRVSVPVQLRIDTALPAWTRQAKDDVLRCVDRAVTRVFPPLDVLQYIGADSPAFDSTGAGVDERAAPATTAPHLVVTFLVQPSAAWWPAALLKPHTVEGEVVAGVRLAAPDTNAAAAALQCARDTQSDLDIWNRARAAQQRYDASVALGNAPQSTEDPVVLQAVSGAETALALEAQLQLSEEKLLQLRWQLARWLTELFMNEGSWARPPPASSTTVKTTSKTPVDAATRRLFHVQRRPAQAHVVAAALAAPPAVPRRFLHVDVRGVEWDGLLVGCTARYAYVAVPYFATPPERMATTTAAAAAAAAPSSCVWTLVSRLPIPAVLGELPGGGVGGGARASRKRPRDAAAAASSTAAARAVLERCINAAEVMRHDKDAAALFRLADAPYIVTVRAHRVYCMRAGVVDRSGPASTTASPAAASPHELSLVLEDAYALRVRPAADDPAEATPGLHWAVSLLCGGGTRLGKGEDRAADAAEEGRQSTTTPSHGSGVARALHTFPDVVSVVRESCHRFQRTHERFCAIYARCTAALRADGAPTDAVEGEVPPATDALPPAAVAAQQLRLLRQAESVFGALSDSVSVHFKKLRGAARPPIPAVRTAADVAHLEESHNVEFKAKVALVKGTAGDVQEAPARHASRSPSPSQRRPALMDTERLRNTMAAMAACRGGVIVVGVADDGRVLGHAKQMDVMRQLRTSGFCPAMVKDTVQVKELRWLGAVAADGEGGSGGPVPERRSMPANWWKGGAKSAETVAATSSSQDLVLTVVSVEKGQAPFYATSKNAPPYLRGCASTTPMPTVVAARRVLAELTLQ